MSRILDDDSKAIEYATLHRDALADLGWHVGAVEMKATGIGFFVVVPAAKDRRGREVRAQQSQIRTFSSDGHVMTVQRIA